MFLIPRTSLSQSVGIFGSTNLGVNNTGAKGVASSVFDISATGKGLLIPRMATGDRPASPALSLLIFNTTLNQYEYWDGAAWVAIAAGSGPWLKSVNYVFLNNSADSVGVGTSTPAQKFEVVGNIRYSGKLMPGGSAGNIGEVLTVDGAGFNIWNPLPSGANAWTKLFNKVYLSDNLNDSVGVGTSSPAERFDVEGNIRYSGKLKPNGTFGSVGDVLSIDGAGFNVWTPLPSGANAWTKLFNKVYLSDNLNDSVGVGTSSPAERFDVSGNIRYSGKLKPNGTFGSIGDVLSIDGAGDNVWTPLPSGANAWTKLFNKVYLSDNLNDSVGVGTTSPAERFDVEGRIRIGALVAPGTTTDKLYNVGGNLFWNGTQLNSGSVGWSTLGNTGTVDGPNFIGTTDDIPFNIRVNNQKAGRIDNTLHNVYLGYLAGNGNTVGDRSVFIGDSAGYSNTMGVRNIFVGYRAGYNSTGGSASYNLFMGFDAGFTNTSGSQNTFLGYAAGFLNSTGVNNHAIGYLAGRNNNANNNFFEGYYAGYENTSGTANTFIGFQAGYTGTPANAVTSGSNNTFVGYNTGFATATQRSNAAAIGYNAKVDASNALILGGTGADAVNVGIGTTLPLATLDITNDGGTVLFPRKSSVGDPAGAANGMIYYNANSNKFRIYENGAWADMVAGAGSAPWSRTAPYIYPTTGTDNVGIGTTSPSERLEVTGNGLFGTTTFGIKVSNLSVQQTGTASNIYLEGGSTSGNVYARPGTTGAFYVELPSATKLMTVLSSGNVGIGTTSPLTRLHMADNSQNGIVSQVSSPTTFPYLAAYRSRGTVGAESAIMSNDVIGGIIFMSHNGTTVGDAAYIFSKATENHGTGRGSELQFHTTTNTIGSPTPKMVIDNAGNMGIGTTSPGARLHVKQSASNVDVIRIEDDDTGDRFGLAYVWESPNPSLRTNYNGTDLFTIQHSGNIGIGTTVPTGKLQIVGDAALGDGTAANEGVITVFLTNNTGAASVKGEIVIVDPAVNNAFVKTTTAGHTSVIGVVYESGVAPGSPCKIAISGIVPVIADAGTTRGQHCITGTATAGAAGSVATPGAGTSIGVWLENVAVSAQGKVLLR